MKKPILDLLGDMIQDHYRRMSEAKYMKTGLSLQETIKRFLDETIDLKDRRNFAFRLARTGTPEAMAALREVLKSTSAADKAFIANLIGRAGNPDSIPLLDSLINDDDQKVGRTAIRAIGLIGGDLATERISTILSNSEHAQALRIESAVVLGDIGTPVAQRALVEAFARMPSNDLAGEILNSLGSYDFNDVSPTFRSYLSSPDAESELRVVAAEALSNSTPEAVPFLLNITRSDHDADVRAAAAWAISTQPTVENIGNQLLDIAYEENEVDVRRRVYEAMLTQTGATADQILPLVMKEEDTAARIAGLNALGSAARDDPDSMATTSFDSELVPELQQLATTSQSLNFQLRAVFALRRAGTPAAHEALRQIADLAPPQVAAAALNGLQATSP